MLISSEVFTLKIGKIAQLVVVRLLSVSSKNRKTFGFKSLKIFSVLIM